MSSSSKLLANGQYGIYVNDELVATTTSRARLESLMQGLREKLNRGRKSNQPPKVA